MFRFMKTMLVLMILLISLGLQAIDITIGEGTTTNLLLPIYPYYGYTYSQQIFYQSEINLPNSQITAVSFYWNGLSAAPNSSQNWTVYLGHTTLTTFETATSWIPSTNLTPVYTGPVNITAEAGWVTIQLPQPFIYNNTSNLVIAVDENQALYDGSDEYFLGTETAGINRSIRYYNDTTNPDPTAPPTGTLVAGYSNTKLTFQSLSPTPVFNVYPVSKNFGQTLIGTTPSQTFTVGNAGGGNFTLSSISIAGSPFYTLQNLPTLPVTLTSATPVTFVVRYSPTAAGVHNATVTLTDNLTRTTHTIPITGTCFDPSINTFPYAQSFDEDTFPPAGWSNVALSGTTLWARSTAGTYPTCTPHSGAGMGYYNSFSASSGYEAKLTTPPFVFANSAYRLKFWMMHDPGYTTNPDSIIVFYGNQRIGAFWRYAQTQEWIEHEIPLPVPQGGQMASISFLAHSGYGNSMYIDDILVEAISATPSFACSLSPLAPYTYNFGDKVINTSTNYSFNISNNGGGSLGINNISISGNYFSLVNPPATPLNLIYGQPQPIVVNYAPTQAGPHSATITVTDNLTRVVHTITITGTCFDPTIVTFPYTENFDLVTIPELPLGWQKLVNSTSTATCVSYTSTTTVNSPPNAISMSNSADAMANVLLITPPIQNANTKRIKIFSRGAGADYPLIIGYMTNPSDANTFVPLQTVNLTTTFTQYLVSLASLPANAQFVAFKHGNGSTYRTLYLDDFTVENLPTVPEYVTNTSAINYGNVYQNTPYSYPVIITNTGAMPLTVTWSLPTDITINPSGITTVPAGFSSTINVILTPLTQGPYTSSILLATNDPAIPADTISVTANVLPPLPEGLVEIGTGTVLDQNMPWEPYYRYSYSQSIYLANQLPATTGNRIHEIGFQFNGNSVFTDSIRVYMGYTTASSFASTTSWIPLENLTLVYDGTFTTEVPASWIMLELLPQFDFIPGQNLVVAVQEYQGGNYHTGSDDFYCTATPTVRSLNFYNDTTFPTPAAPPAGTLKSFIPNTRFFIAPPPTSPIFVATPTDKNFGTIQINNSSAPQIFTIRNRGIGQLQINSIQLTGTDPTQFQLINNNALPTLLGPNQSMTISAAFHPTTVGNKTASITVTDNLTRTAHTIPLYGLGFDATIVTFPYTENFDTVTIPTLPIGWLKILNTTSTSAYINSYTGTLANSAPNAVQLYNSADATASMLLITPPIQNANSKRVKFFAKGGAGYSMEVGYITNPLVDSTFVPLQTINPPTAYTQYIVSLAAAPAGLQRVAFRHGNGGTYRTIYLDDVIFENLPTTSEITVSTEPLDFGTIYQYLPASNQIIISNTGILPLTINWTLPAHVSINPPGNTTINPGINTTMNIIINAQNQGTFSGNLVLNTNDPAHATVTIPITANVLPPLPPGLIEIGSGTELNQNMPWEPFYRYSYSQTIYTGSQLMNTGGPRITELSYHFNGNSAFTDSIRVYIGYTNLNEFPTTTSWVPYDSLSLAYDGPFSTEAQDAWINIVLQNPFFYTPGRNIVIATYEYLGGNYHTGSDDFFCTLTTTNKSLNYYNDTTNPNPMSPPSGNLKTYIPNTRILFGSPQVPPMNLQALIGNGTVTLTWLAPQLGDDNVRNQKIERNNINENYSFSSNSSRTTNDRISLVNYKVYRNNTEIAFLPTTELSFTDTGLVNGITYTYYVTGIYLDPDGESGPSNIIQVIPDGSILNPPVNLTSQLSENNVSLNWQNGLFTLSEGFENQGIPVNWNSCDVDGDENNWFTFTNAPHTGGQCIASASYTAELGALNPNNWLVSTPINVGNNAYLYWWVAGQDPAHLGDQYKVYITTNGNDFSDFGASSFNEVVNTTTWTRKQLSLATYAGQTIWVAFAHQNSPNHSILKLDDVVVVSAITTTQNLPSKTINTNNSKKDNQSINNKICLNNQASHKVVTNNSRLLTGYKVYRNDQPVAQTEPEVFTFMDQLTTSGEYTYYVTTLYSEGESEPSNVMTVNITENNDVIVTPLVTALKRNYPNPFNPETSIAFDLASAGNVEINIYNAKGQKVKTLISEFKNPGSYKAVWNGKDSNNQNCGSGIYFYKMKSGKYTSTGKMILMK